MSKEKRYVLPHDPLLFAKQYRDMRRTIDDEIKDPRILRIHFEDLIYRYDFTTKQINEFLGISEEKHKDLRKHFNPDISIRNTQDCSEEDRKRSGIPGSEEGKGRC